MARPSRLLDLQKSLTSNKATTSANATNSPLLKLPAEIRQRIYNYVLGGNVLHVASGEADGPHRVVVCKNDGDYAHDVAHRSLKREPGPMRYLRYSESDSNICLSSHEQCYRAPTAQTRFSLSLLRICRQIYREAVLVPFKNNVFAATADNSSWRFHHLREFHGRLVPTQARAINHLIVQAQWEGAMRTTTRADLELFGGLTNLQYILPVHASCFSSPLKWVEIQETRFSRNNLANLKLPELQNVNFEIRKFESKFYYLQDSDDEGNDADLLQLPSVLQDWVESVERRMLGGS